MSLSGFTELEKDALTEIINMGMSKAASVMSQMVNEEVSLSVPIVSIMSRLEAIRHLEELASGQISGVTQDFKGVMNGRAMLLFPEQQSLNLVRLLLKNNVPLEMMTEMEKEALTEIGNIILNACFGTIANTLSFDLESSIPNFVKGESEQLMGVVVKDNIVLILQVDFILATKNIQGFVTFLMDVTSSDILKQHIKTFVSNVVDQEEKGG